MGKKLRMIDLGAGGSLYIYLPRLQGFAEPSRLPFELTRLTQLDELEARTDVQEQTPHNIYPPNHTTSDY